jgi:hypothetical protein
MVGRNRVPVRAIHPGNRRSAASASHPRAAMELVRPHGSASDGARAMERERWSASDGARAMERAMERAMIGAIDPAVEAIRECRAHVPRQRTAVLALSGIAGSGKGYLAHRVAAELRARGLRVAVLGVDPWLDLPERRLSRIEPARHFYRHAIRFAAYFEQLVLPLRARRSVRLVADGVGETVGGVQLRDGPPARDRTGPGRTSARRDDPGLPDDLLPRPADPLRAGPAARGGPRGDPQRPATGRPPRSRAAGGARSPQISSPGAVAGLGAASSYPGRPSAAWVSRLPSSTPG